MNLALHIFTTPAIIPVTCNPVAVTKNSDSGLYTVYILKQVYSSGRSIESSGPDADVKMLRSTSLEQIDLSCIVQTTGLLHTN
jgi:hypothetical protein